MGDQEVPERVRAELLRISEDPQADLAEGALWISALENPGLAIANYLEWLRQTAADAQASSPKLDAPALLGVLRDELKFCGDEQRYYDVRNSHLDQVIDRRRGIPITLSLVYLGLATRTGEDAAGINAPGHFLVRHGTAIVDPFRGILMNTTEFTAHLTSLGIPRASQEATRLLNQPTDHRSILIRMLVNLRGIHLQTAEFAKGLAVVDLLTHLDAANLEWVRDRGLLYRKLDCPDLARSDFERYLREAADPDAAERIREVLASMEENPRVLH